MEKSSVNSNEFLRFLFKKTSSNRKLMKLYNTGNEMISKAYSIDKIIRDIRNTKYIVKNHLSKSLSKRTLFEIQHGKKFVIEIDSDDGKLTPDKAILKI